MDYKKVSINGISYGEDAFNDPGCYSMTMPSVKNVDFTDKRIYEIL